MSIAIWQDKQGYWYGRIKLDCKLEAFNLGKKLSKKQS
jgi:hypothetical protein